MHSCSQSITIHLSKTSNIYPTIRSQSSLAESLQSSSPDKPHRASLYSSFWLHALNDYRSDIDFKSTNRSLCPLTKLFQLRPTRRNDDRGLSYILKLSLDYKLNFLRLILKRIPLCHTECVKRGAQSFDPSRDCQTFFHHHPSDCSRWI